LLQIARDRHDNLRDKLKEGDFVAGAINDLY